jgi:hypothetical protein
MRAPMAFAIALLLGCSSASEESNVTEDDSGSTTTGDSSTTTDDAATGGDTTTSSSDTGTSTTDIAPPSASFDGYWVWKEVIEDGKTTLTITDADMQWKVGASGWPGCPAGISCTKYGIHVFYANATRLHHMHRVTTGSDSQEYGSYTAADGVITFKQEQTFSCAHPKDPSTYPNAKTLYARYKRMGDDFLITPWADKDPGAAATKWTVYRPISKVDAHNKYDHPFCGEVREGGKCHCLCPSQDVLVDYTCATK